MKDVALTDDIKEDPVSKIKAFLETSPIYTKLRLDIPIFMKDAAPEVVNVVCSKCKGERPFRQKPDAPYPHPVCGGYVRGAISSKCSGVYEFYYYCTDCRRQSVQYFVEVNYTEDWIRKIGQVPPWSIDISKELEKDLGVDAALYKKALTLMSQSYGIGACVYLRRMIEHQINPLLEILYQIRQLEGASPEQLQEITDALQSKNFIDKVAKASSLVPISLVVEGHNPLKLIYEQLSINIHSRDDDESMNVALKIKPAFEYLIIELNRQRDAKKKFIDSIKSLSE